MKKIDMQKQIKSNGNRANGNRANRANGNRANRANGNRANRANRANGNRANRANYKGLKNSNNYFKSLINKGLKNLSVYELTTLMLFLRKNTLFAKNLKELFNNQYINLYKDKAFANKFKYCLIQMKNNVNFSNELQIEYNKLLTITNKANQIYFELNKDLNTLNELKDCIIVKKANHKLTISDLLIKANKDNTKINLNYKVTEKTIYKSFNVELFNLNKFKISDLPYQSIKITYYDYTKVFVLFDKDNKDIIKELECFNYRYFNLKNYFFDNSINAYYLDLQNNKDNLSKYEKLNNAFKKSNKKLSKTKFIDKHYKIDNRKINKDYKKNSFNQLKLNNVYIYSYEFVKVFKSNNNLYEKIQNNKRINKKIDNINKKLILLNNLFKYTVNYSKKFKNYIKFYTLKEKNLLKYKKTILKFVFDNNLFKYSNQINLLLNSDYINQCLFEYYSNEYLRLNNLKNKLELNKSIIEKTNNSFKTIKNGYTLINLNKVKKEFDLSFNNVIFEDNKKVKDYYLNKLDYIKNNLVYFDNSINDLIDYITFKTVEDNNKTNLNEFVLYKDIKDRMQFDNYQFNCNMKKHNTINDKERPILNNWSYEHGKLRLIK